MLYPIAIEPPNNEQTAFGVVVPDVPGCYSAGDTMEEALANAREAIEAHLELLSEEGAIPLPSAIVAHLSNPAYSGWIWALSEVDENVFLGKSEKINVTLPELLIKKIDSQVAKIPAYKNRSQFLATAALKELQQGVA